MSLSEPFEIRSAHPNDALCVGALATQVFFDTYATNGINPDLAIEAKDHYSEEVLARRLASSEVEITVAEVKGNLAGFIDVQNSSCCPTSSITGPEVLRLYIQRPFQGKGLGRALLKHAEERARVQGAKAIWLTAWVGNTRAVAFYPLAGYEKVGAMEYLISGKVYENHVFAKRLHVSGA
jgi:ribosomal protein S18 acetylase RimI-like enzyme